jgi:hypothetical protein
MSLKKDIEDDISEFFRQTHKQSDQDKKKALMILFDKYIHLSTATELLTKYDFDMIKSNAIKLFTDRAWPKKFNNSYQEVSGQEAPNFSLVESTISYLNSKDCLKKMPKFDYKKGDSK